MAQELTMLPDEQIKFKLEGDVYGGGANPVAQMVAQIQAKIMKIFGTKLKATLVVTNKRIIEVRETITCYCVPTSVEVRVIVPGSIKEVGWLKMTSCFVFSYFSFFYESHTQKTVFPFKGGSDKELQKTVDEFYKTILDAQK